MVLFDVALNRHSVLVFCFLVIIVIRHFFFLVGLTFFVVIVVLGIRIVCEFFLLLALAKDFDGLLGLFRIFGVSTAF